MLKASMRVTFWKQGMVSACAKQICDFRRNKLYVVSSVTSRPLTKAAECQGNVVPIHLKLVEPKCC